ncbi:MAG: hypothetical protein JJ855_13110 [Rhodospirillales bacterium]|nr:hypothetical protein [Rhodospirillales bacterium]
MRLKCALIAVSVLLATGTAHAAIDPNVERHARVTSCKLSPAEETVLNDRWNKLAMRHFMASMGNGIDPAEASRIRRQVDQGLEDLRRRFGAACVLKIY